MQCRVDGDRRQVGVDYFDALLDAQPLQNFLLLLRPGQDGLFPLLGLPDSVGLELANEDVHLGADARAPDAVSALP